MKKLVIFFVICYFTLPVSGQITAGISAGPSFSTMSVHLRDLTTFRIKPIVGFNLNFIADIKLNSSLSLSTGMSFSQKGFRQTLYYPIFSLYIGGNDNSYKLPGDSCLY